jgi:hypothetical protein
VYASYIQCAPCGAGYNDEEWEKYIDARLDRSKPRHEGFIEETWTDHSRPAWRALDMRYDQCVGNYQCSPERDEPEVQFSVHFSCLHDIAKPGAYKNEHDLLYNMYTFSESSTRYWFKRWYETYKRAAGRFDPPYWDGPEVPGRNETHDEIIMANRYIRDHPPAR